MRIALLVPAPLRGLSGDATYDRAMLNGLRCAGHDAQAIEFTDAAAVFAALADDVLPVIEGAGLAAFHGHATALAERRTVGLIHHPATTDAEPGLMSKLARVIATSAATASRLGIEPARLTVVAPGTAEAPRSAGSGNACCAILSVGTLVPRKGHDLLLRALSRLFDLEWHLTIVGSAGRDPDHARSLHTLAEQLGLARRVTFAGETDPATLESLWQRADFFALATCWESHGMAIAEALKRGIPVAVTAGGAAGALVTPRSGVLCAPGDEVTLSKSLRRLIFDPAVRRKIAAAAWMEGQALPDWTTQARAFAAALVT